MLFLMDENYCFQCFCTEKYEKCVRPDKNLSLKAALQGRENKIKRLLCRNLATGLPDNRAPKPWGQGPQSGKSRFRDTPANPDFAISPQIPICTSTLSYFRPVFHQVPKEPAAITAISPQRPGNLRKKAQNAAKRSKIKLYRKNLFDHN